MPLDKPQVPQGAELQIYYEPVNVFTNRNKAKVLYEQEELLNFRYSSRSPVFDLYATNSLNLGDLGPGTYLSEVNGGGRT